MSIPKTHFFKLWNDTYCGSCIITDVNPDTPEDIIKATNYNFHFMIQSGIIKEEFAKIILFVAIVDIETTLISVIGRAKKTEDSYKKTATDDIELCTQEELDELFSKDFDLFKLNIGNVYVMECKQNDGSICILDDSTVPKKLFNSLILT